MLINRYLSFGLVLATAISVNVFADGPASSPEKEKEFLSKLQSGAPDAEKAIACKQLAIYGSSASVGELAKLLPNPQLSSWARIALEAIPGPEADDALRKASESLEGNLLVGTINSIGVRRDANAVAVLSPRLQDKNADVASAAAVALGRIGTDEAVKPLRAALAASTGAVRSAIAEGCVLCAERFHLAGNTAEAILIYDQVRGAEVPAQRVIEATRGAILARGKDGIPLLTELFHSKDKGLFQLSLGVAREFPGSDLDPALAAELLKAEPARAALIVQAMADRKNTVILAAVLKAAEAGPKVVRLSAVDALSRVGDVTCLVPLLKIAVEDDTDLSNSARATLAVLPGDKVDDHLITQLELARGATYPVLLDLIGKRRIDAVSSLLKALDHEDAAVRTAALNAMGETVALKDLNVLIAQALNPKRSEDELVAQAALKAASIRMADREACATELTMALENAKTVATKGVLLQILGAVGGSKALETIAGTAKNGAAPLQDISSRLLGEWMTEDAAPVLLDLAKLNSNPYQIRAMRGYIRIARQFVLPDDQRMVMCQNAYDAARQPAEKKLILEVLKRYPTLDGIKLATKAMKTPDIKEDATQATLIIAQKLGAKGVDVKELLTSAGIEKMKVEIVKAEYGAGATQRDVTEVVKSKVGDLPLIDLDSTSFNASFGGDPAPGTAKKLKIQYKIDGKPGEATFGEDAIIILPMPK